MIRFYIIISTLLLIQSCGIYSFSGTSIEADINTCSIEYFQNKAQKINPALSNSLSEALIDQFDRLTKLEITEEAGDINISGDIISYEVSPIAMTADEVAAQNRLTIEVKIMYTNRLYPEKDFEKSFSAYADYNSTQSLDAVESTLTDQIIDLLVEDIFNATVANW